MIRSLTTLICLAALPLSACSRDAGGEKDASAGNAATSGAVAKAKPAAAPAPAAAGGAPSLKPGMWETTTEMTEMKMEGAPAAANAAFKPTRTVTKHCVTPQQASAGVPNMEPPQHGGRCDIQNRSWSGGTINLAMSCSGPNGEGRADIKATGRYDDSSFTMDNATSMTGPNGVRINSRMRVSGKRVGDCAG